VDEVKLEHRLTSIEKHLEHLTSLVKHVRDNEQKHIKFLLGALLLTLIPLILKILGVV